MAKIALALIDFPAWNSRITKTGAAAKLEDERIKELAVSFAAEGQLTPIEVETKADGRYEMVFGTRRYRAAGLCQWTEIEANVREPSSAGARIVRNVIENEQRENLNTFEQARAYAQLRELGLSNKDTAAKLGKSPQHVSNLTNAFKNLSDPIKKDWEAQHPAATFDNLRELANRDKFKTDEAQVRAWDGIVAETAKKVAEGGKAGKRGKNKTSNGSSSAGYHLVSANINLAVDVLSSRKFANEKIGGTRKWAYDFAMWLVGVRKTAPEGFDALIPDVSEEN